jgi:glycosyltransferase involved in cell wall biosynthesis
MFEPLGDGGIAHYTFNLANHIEKLGVQTYVYTNKRYELADQDTSFGIRQEMFHVADIFMKLSPILDREAEPFNLIRRALKALEYPFDAVAAALYAIKKKVNIFHVQSVNEIEILAVLTARLAGMKVVFTMHNVMPRHGELKDYQIKIYRALFTHCGRIIIHTESGKREMDDLYGVEPGKISVIPHGDYKFFTSGEITSPEEAKRTLGLPEGSKTILFFGAIRPNKGLDFLLRSFPRVVSKVQRAVLMIIGEPCEDFAVYQRIIDKEGLSASIYKKLEYIPNEDVEKYFLAADVVVLPYREVTGSGILQIAYAFGKPVIATDLPGFRETVSDGENGYLVPKDDPKLLGARIVELLSDNILAAEMGRRSEIYSDTKYSWENVAEETANVYRELSDLESMKYC